MDEMMERLRSGDGSRSSGEGSSGRRRRSSQSSGGSGSSGGGSSASSKSQRIQFEAPDPGRRRRIIIWSSLLGAGFLAGFSYLGIQFAARHRIEGNVFKESLSRRLSSLAGAPVDVKRVSDSGQSTLSASQIDYAGAPQQIMAVSKFVDVSATLTEGSWISSTWEVTKLNTRLADITLDPSKLAQPKSAATWVPPSAPTVAAAGGRSILSSITPEPEAISVDALLFTALQLHWIPQGQTETESFKGSRTSVDIKLDGSMQGMSEGGQLHMLEWSPIDLNSISWLRTENKVTFHSIKATYGRGLVDLSGSLDLQPNGLLQLKGKVQNILLPHLLEGGSKDGLLGKVNLKDVTYTSGLLDGPERELKGKFVVTGFIMRGQPFITKLSMALCRPELDRLEFDEFSGNFRWTTAKGLELTDCKGQVPGGLGLSGDFRWKGSAISGKLHFVADRTMMLSILPTVTGGFAPTADGGALEVLLGGTPHSFTDNLDVSIATSGNQVDPSLQRRQFLRDAPSRPDALRPSPDADAGDDSHRRFKELIR